MALGAALRRGGVIMIGTAPRAMRCGELGPPSPGEDPLEPLEPPEDGSGDPSGAAPDDAPAEAPAASSPPAIAIASIAIIISTVISEPIMGIGYILSPDGYGL